MSFICPYWVQLTMGKWLPFGDFPILYSFSDKVLYGTFIWGHTGAIRNRAGRLSSGCGLPSAEIPARRLQICSCASARCFLTRYI